MADRPPNTDDDFNTRFACLSAEFEKMFEIKDKDKANRFGLTLATVRTANQEVTDAS